MPLPPLPTVRALTAELRALNEAWSHPEAGGDYACGRESMFDAVGAARRLLAAARDYLKARP